jgi:molybdopterin-dependent oxidoreductase alpha subunit
LKGGTKIADYFLQVRIGGDIALMKLLMYEMMKAEQHEPGSVFDHEFIQKQTIDYDAFLSELKSLDRARALSDCGIPEEQVMEVAQLLIHHDKIISCWAMGLTQHKHAVNNIREVVNMHLLRGAVGRKGAGLCPVRGHSNVQGDRTMGIYEKPKPEFLDRLDSYFHIQTPRKHGYDTVEAIEAMNENKVKVFIAMGGNFVSATPDSEFTGKAMQKVPLTVQISTKLNRAHLVTGNRALIVPCLGRTERDLQVGGEQFVTVENSMGVVSRSRGSLEPASVHLRSEPAIVCELAAALLGANKPIDWLAARDNYDLIRNHIEGAIDGFESYNERVRRPDGFYLPNGPREGRFTTNSGKALFTINELPSIDVRPGHLVMMTIRSHDQYNTTIYGLDDRYRGIRNERRVVLMNEKDMAAMFLDQRELVNLIGEYNGVTRSAEQFHAIKFDIPRGCCATYFPETNCLVPIDSFADRSKTPVSKFIEIRIEKRTNAG